MGSPLGQRRAGESVRYLVRGGGVRAVRAGTSAGEGGGVATNAPVKKRAEGSPRKPVSGAGEAPVQWRRLGLAVRHVRREIEGFFSFLFFGLARDRAAYGRIAAR